MAKSTAGEVPKYVVQKCSYCKGSFMKFKEPTTIDTFDRCSVCVVNTFPDGDSECVLVYDTRTENLPLKKMRSNNKNWNKYCKVEEIKLKKGHRRVLEPEPKSKIKVNAGKKRAK